MRGINAKSEIRNEKIRFIVVGFEFAGYEYCQRHQFSVSV
jgi:hypothetical protein